jgi:membrane protein
MVIPGLGGMSLRRFLHELVHEILEHRLIDVAAQLAYNSILALFPFLIFLFTILAFLPVQGAADEILEVVHHTMPGQAAELVDATVNGVVRNPSPRLLAISLVGSIWAAGGGVAALTSALDLVYAAPETRSWLRVRAQSLLVTLLATVLVIVATVGMVIGPHLVERISSWVGLGGVAAAAWRWLRWPSTVLAMSLLLAMLYWACPNVRRRFRIITPGSVIAIPVWIGVSELFSLYVSHFGSFNKTYGTLGAGVVLLTWIYLTGLIVLVGGAMNAIIERAAPEGVPASAQPRPARA